MKIFISGSAGFGNQQTITVLPDDIKTELQTIIDNNDTVLIGDCAGIDTLVQNFFAEKNYDNVEVYFTWSCRNLKKRSWLCRNIPTNGLSGRAGRACKDIAMANDADAGIAIWNEISTGTGDNIRNLKAQNKPVRIYSTKSNTWLS